ncbi:MAG: hypothetical protein NVV63_13615 [Opitutus sp.]|nr:hypothetical protein [Opitutus sp.]
MEKLRYAGEAVPPIKHWDERGLVLYASTFSKTIAPGLRLGWVVASPEVFSRLLILKQASDLHPRASISVWRMRFSRRTISRCTSTRSAVRMAIVFRSWTRRCGRKCRRASRGRSLRAACFCGSPVRRGLDGLKLLERAITRQVAFVPGRDFFPAEGGANHLRLNFSNSTPERIREGVKRLATICRELAAS